MTIYTAQNVANQEKKEVTFGDHDVSVQLAGKLPEDPEEQHDQDEDDLQVLDPGREAFFRAVAERRKKRMCVQLVLFTLVIMGLCVSILGSIYLYRLQHSKRYVGWCGVKYISNTSEPRTSYLDEEVNVDADLETLEVPKLDDSDQAVIMHDFQMNITAIKDITDSVCYVLPLDREKIPIPKDFLDLLFRMAHGDYVPDATEIRQDYRVQQPAVVDKETEFGAPVASLCSAYDTFWLVKYQEAGEVPTTTTLAPVSRSFKMYAGGDFMMHYDVRK